MVSAVAAGMIAIGVTAGSAVDAATLEGAGAAAVVGSLDELAAALILQIAPDGRIAGVIASMCAR